MKKKLLLLLVVPVLFLVAVLAIAAVNLRNGVPLSAAGDSRSADSGGQGESEAGSFTDDSGSTDDAGNSAAKRVVATEPMRHAVISTGQVSLHPESISKARAEVMRLVSSWGGTVADEQTTSDRGGRVVESTMTLRVPTAKFSEALAAFGELGKVEHQSRKSEDVSTKVIDTDARVRAAERSIRQIENLLARAQKLSDVIAVESDLARRQADLDSLKSQQAYLADQTSLSTINVYLSRDGARPKKDETRGFLAGLDGGWTALKGATAILLTVIGAVLPFALVLVVLGVPIWLVVRRWLRGARLSAGSAPAQSA